MAYLPFYMWLFVYGECVFVRARERAWSNGIMNFEKKENWKSYLNYKSIYVQFLSQMKNTNVWAIQSVPSEYHSTIVRWQYLLLRLQLFSLSYFSLYYMSIWHQTKRILVQITVFEIKYTKWSFIWLMILYDAFKGVNESPLDKCLNFKYYNSFYFFFLLWLKHVLAHVLELEINPIICTSI